MDGHALELELESPAVNLVGFEHTPRDDAERAALKRAEAILKDGGSLFGLPESAGCRLAESSVDSPLLAAEPATQGAEHGHEAEIHADLDAAYRFACAHREALDRVEVRLFGVFPATQRLRVQYATDKGQGATELTPGNPWIDL